MPNVHTQIDGRITRQCFRCGNFIENFQNGGQVTIAGFYSTEKPFPYYNNFTLCEQCHDILMAKINEVLYTLD